MKRGADSGSSSARSSILEYTSSLSGRISWFFESIISARMSLPSRVVRNHGIQTAAWGSLARDVPRRNLRSFSFVSGEKEYSRDSAWGRMSA